MADIRRRLGRALNRALAPLDLAVSSRRALHDLGERARQPSRAAPGPETTAGRLDPARVARSLGRDGAFDDQPLYAFDADLVGAVLADTHRLGRAVLVVGRGRAAERIREALLTTGREVQAVGTVHEVGRAGSAGRAEDFSVILADRESTAGVAIVREQLPESQPILTLSRLLGTLALFACVHDVIGFHVRPPMKAWGWMTGNPAMAPLAALNDRYPIAGRTVIEFGPLDGCMTGGLIAYGAQRVHCVEVRTANVLKLLAARQLLGWDSVSIAIDDMHHVDAATEGTFDLVVAHGVYYHSADPFRFLENLLTLGPTIYLGGYCADVDRPDARLVELAHDGQTYRAQPYLEKSHLDAAGIHGQGFYFVPEDLAAFFERRGRSVEILALDRMPADRNAGFYLRALITTPPRA